MAPIVVRSADETGADHGDFPSGVEIKVRGRVDGQRGVASRIIVVRDIPHASCNTTVFTVVGAGQDHKATVICIIALRGTVAMVR
jgi:hypothetical protein